MYQSQVCKSEKNLGEEIVRLMYAIDLFKAAQQRINKSKFFFYFVYRAECWLTEARENISAEIVLPRREYLAEIGTTDATISSPLDKPMSSKFVDMFKELLPISVHQALATYEIRRHKFVNTEILKLREATQRFNTIVTCSNLPAAIEDTRGIEVPMSISFKASYIREAGGIENIEYFLEQFSDLLRRNSKKVQEIEEMLLEDLNFDGRLKEKIADKWPGLASSLLTDQLLINIKKYRTVIDTALAAEIDIQQQFAEHREIGRAHV